MARERCGHYRQLARLALQWSIEPVDGVYSNPRHPAGLFCRQFDPTVLDFKIDVERILRAGLRWPEYVALVLLHRDGLTCEEAVRAAAAFDPEWQHGRPDNLIALAEHKAGLILTRAGMTDIRAYFQK